MKKISFLWILLRLIFLILFNVLFFMFVAYRPTSVWISYGFTHLAYFMIIINSLLNIKTKSRATLGLSLQTLSLVYFLAQLILGLIFIILAPVGWKSAFATQLILACLYIFVLILNLITNEDTARQETRSQNDLDHFRFMLNKAVPIMESAATPEEKKIVEKVVDALRGSPTRSHPAVANLDNEIITSLDTLSLIIRDHQVDQLQKKVTELLAKITERNRILMSLN